MKKSIGIIFLTLAVCLFLFGGTVYSAEADGKTRLSKSSGADEVLQSNGARRTLVNVGQVAMWIYADGLSANSPNSDSGLFYPRGNNPATAVIYQDGMVWGGIVNDGNTPALRVGGQTYSSGTVPGAIISKGVAEDRTAPDVNRLWRIRRDYVDADLRQDAAEINQTTAASVTQGQIDAVRAIYRLDWVDWPAEKGAPFYDVDGDGNYSPGFYTDANGVERPKTRDGADIDGDGVVDDITIGDEPGVADADQVVWLVANDLHASTVQTLYGSPSIGMEMQVTLWAYARSDALGNIIFKQFRMIYKGTETTPATATIDSFYVCQWSDPDLGEFGDDFAGSDTTLSLGYAYNSSSNDPTYAPFGLAPPASGYDFFAGPLVDAPGETGIFGLQEVQDKRNLGMSSFAFFAAGGEDSDPDRGGDYNGTLQWWNLLTGNRPRPESPAEPWTTPDGEETMFRVPGDPVAGTGWIDGQTDAPGDRRILLVSGPTTMALGDTAEVVVAVIGALGSDRLSSVSALKFYDESAQFAFDNLFDLPGAPPSPNVNAAELDGKIVLNWGHSENSFTATESADAKGYLFEGYNIYQLPSAGASADQGVRLATYDLVNEATVIAQDDFDASSGLVLELPVQFGRNSGIKRTFVVENDALRDKGLYNGQTYYFGVSAYNYNPDEITKTIESPMTVVTVTPQTPKPGGRLSADVGQQISDSSGVVVHDGVSYGDVELIVVDPTQVTGHEYQVTFREDTSLNSIVWDLRDVTAGETKLTDQLNQSGDDDYPIVDGIMAKVLGAPSDWAPGDGSADGIVEVATPDGPAAPDAAGAPFNGNKVWHGLNSTADYYVSAGGGGGGLDRISRYVGAAVPNDFELRFTDAGGWAVYAFEDDKIARVPFEIWDIGVATPDDPSDDRRMIPFILSNDSTKNEWGYANGEDPYFGFPSSDWIYWMEPEDLSPGTASYDAFAATCEGIGAGGTYPYDTDGSVDGYFANFAYKDAGGFVYPIGRMIICDYAGDGTPPGSGTVIRVHTTKPNAVNDVFTYSTSQFMPTESQADAEVDMDLMNVFPNPYYGFHEFEQNRFQRYVTISHLPEIATIRIFNLAGVLVRTLEKDDPSQFLNWDLLNESGLPVASGLYLVNIEVPNMGSRTIKLALVQEQQFLNAY